MPPLRREVGAHLGASRELEELGDEVVPLTRSRKGGLRVAHLAREDVWAAAAPSRAFLSADEWRRRQAQRARAEPTDT